MASRTRISASTTSCSARCSTCREGGTDKWTLSSLTVNYQASVGTFTSSTSYFDRTTFEHEDSSDVLQLYLGYPDLIPGPITLMRGLTRFAQEARFASDFTGPFQIVTRRVLLGWQGAARLRVDRGSA